jgi:recombination protein RecA
MKALQLTVRQTGQVLWQGHVMKLGDSKVMGVEAIPTGSIRFGYCTRNWWPAKRKSGGNLRTGIFGKNNLGHSGNCQLPAQAGGIAAFIDAEHAFDKVYAEKLGVDVNNLLISQPDDGEQALDITEHLIRSGAIDIIVIDSVAALVPRSRT